jgi:hypothetical protein
LLVQQLSCHTLKVKNDKKKCSRQKAREQVLDMSLCSLKELKTHFGLSLSMISNGTAKEQDKWLDFYEMPPTDDSMFSGCKWHPKEYEVLDVMQALGFSENTIKKQFPTRSKSAVQSVTSCTKNTKVHVVITTLRYMLHLCADKATD